MNKDVFGNSSKHSQNWIAGPTHNVRKQHVPGYTGHIRGMVNRDAMPKSYAKVTATLAAKKHPIEVDNSVKGRFSSTQRDEYRLSNNRRFGKYLTASARLSKFKLCQNCLRRGFSLKRFILGFAGLMKAVWVGGHSLKQTCVSNC
jgi:hypothetical protein